MIIEGVTFIEPAVKAMKKSDFINKHMPVIWQDRPEDDRKKRSRKKMSDERGG